MKNNEMLILTSVASMIDQFIIPNIELLNALGYRVHVACNFEEGNTCTAEQIDYLKDTLEVMGVVYHQIDFKRSVTGVLSNFKAYKQVLNLMKNNKFQFIHCHSPIGGLCGRMAGKKTNTKVIYTAHGFHFYRNAPIINWLLYYPIEKWLSKYTNILITINKEDYNRALNFKANKTMFIPGIGINIEKFANLEIDKVEKRGLLGYSSDDYIMLSVGELNRNKNHEAILRAISKINNTKIKYLICGKGPLENYLGELTEELNIGNQVRFLGYRNDIPTIMKVADLFVFPSLREGLPVSLMEAMASGLPIICSNIRGNNDLITDGKGGFLVNTEEEYKYSERISELYTDFKISNMFSNYNKNAIGKYSLQNINNQMLEVYKSINL